MQICIHFCASKAHLETDLTVVSIHLCDWQNNPIPSRHRQIQRMALLGIRLLLDARQPRLNHRQYPPAQVALPATRKHEGSIREDRTHLNMRVDR